jgi:hypothetical protein
MSDTWKPDDTEEQWGETRGEPWRGDLHQPGLDEWCLKDTGEVWAGEDFEEADSGEPGWPEQLAGPEYWMYRKAA